MNELNCDWIEFKYLSLLTSNDRGEGLVGETSLEGDLSLSDHRMGTAQDNDSFDTGTQDNSSLPIMAYVRHVSHNGLDWLDLADDTAFLLSAEEKHASLSTMIAIDGKRRHMYALLR